MAGTPYAIGPGGHAVSHARHHEDQLATLGGLYQTLRGDRRLWRDHHHRTEVEQVDMLGCEGRDLRHHTVTLFGQHHIQARSDRPRAKQ